MVDTLEIGSSKALYRIFIAENVPSLNKGEMSILEGMLESFKVLGNTKVSMLSPLPAIDRPRYGAKINIIGLPGYATVSGVPTMWRRFTKTFPALFFIAQHLIWLVVYKILGARTLKFTRSEVLRELAQCDAILLGHNGAFGLGGGLGSPVTFYPWFVPFFAKALGKPVVFYGGSVDSAKIGLLRPFLKIGNKLALRQMDLITLREGLSLQRLKEMGLGGQKIQVTADPVFLLPPAPEEKGLEIMRQEGIIKGASLLVGMTATREIASLAYPQEPALSYGKHVTMLAEIIDCLVSELNAFVVFVPHCLGFGEHLDDRVIAGDVFQTCQNKNRVKVITTEYAAGELKSLLGQFELFIGERIHSVINAMSMCVPSIAMSYRSDQRLDIIRMVGQDNAIYYVEDLDVREFVSRLKDILSRSHKIRQELKSQIEIMKERAQLNGKLLKEVIERRRPVASPL